jgi:hypothetical protein
MLAQPIADVFAHLMFECDRAQDRRDAAVTVLKVVLQIEQPHPGKIKEFAMISRRALQLFIELEELVDRPWARFDILFSLRFRVPCKPGPRIFFWVSVGDL